MEDLVFRAALGIALICFTWNIKDEGAKWKS
jgi:hypothetical protein